jgi:hypothetical protein
MHHCVLVYVRDGQISRCAAIWHGGAVVGVALAGGEKEVERVDGGCAEQRTIKVWLMEDVLVEKKCNYNCSLKPLFTVHVCYSNCSINRKSYSWCHMCLVHRLLLFL